MKRTYWLVLCLGWFLFLSLAAILSVRLGITAESTGTADAAAKVMSNQARDEAAAKEADAGWYTEALKGRDARVQWFRDAKFGCFIHWGVYADLAGEYKGKKGGSYSEHIMRQFKIPRQTYLEEVANPFNCDKFDADAWVKLIKAAGMRYLVITAKHHDGFAMYPSDVSTFDITDATKFKRDPMQELAEACKKNGVHFGFYYSHAWDWEHPDAPGNDWDYENAGGDKHLFDEREADGTYKVWYTLHPELIDKTQKYVDAKAIPQLQELIAKYHPEIFWFDVSGKMPFSQQMRVVKAVRAADPKVVINGRAARGVGRNFGDYLDTADNPQEVRETDGDWEAIPTVNNSYGYNKRDNNYKTPEFFIRLLAKITAKGGNTLLNIGPKGDGTIDENATRILTGIGRWMDTNGESIHGATRTPLDRQAWGDSTVKGNTLYLHVFQWPTDGKLVVGNLQGDVANAYLLADTSKQTLKSERINGKDLQVTVPAQAPDATDTVVVLQMKGPVQGSKGRLLATNVAENQFLAFDAKPTGRFTYGDGKAGKYFAAGFKNAGDAMSWPIRTSAPAKFDVFVRYSGGKEAKLVVQAGDQKVSDASEAPNTETGSQVVKLGTVSLPAGETELKFQPEQPAELSLFEVVLKPVK